MAGKKGRSGGSRKGAGRKALPPETFNKPIPTYVTETAPMITAPLIQPVLEKVEIQVMDTADLKNLECPIEFETMPFAKQAWQYILDLDKDTHLFNERHYESLKSYCLAIELRQTLIGDWERQGKPCTITTKNGEIKINPTLTEISKQSDRINGYAEDLGLTVLSEFKMAKEKQTSPTLTKKEEKKKQSLFD